VTSAVTPFATVEEAVEDVRNGKMVVVVDDPERENEGDLVVAAQFATPEVVNFMATHARGLICLCLTSERCEQLGLPQMTQRNEARLGTAFTVSVEAREGVTTGISAADRAHTIQVAIDPASTPHDLVQPGHVTIAGPPCLFTRRLARLLRTDAPCSGNRRVTEPEPAYHGGNDGGPHPNSRAL